MPINPATNRPYLTADLVALEIERASHTIDWTTPETAAEGCCAAAAPVNGIGCHVVHRPEWGGPFGRVLHIERTLRSDEWVAHIVEYQPRWSQPGDA